MKIVLLNILSLSIMESSFVCNEFVLKPQSAWPACAAVLPTVGVKVWLASEHLMVRWDVLETEQTYRCVVDTDGGPCWQDSCVEAFIKAQDGSSDYFNFEFNSAGFCLAARGPNRHERSPISQAMYSLISRKIQLASTNVNGLLTYHWNLEVSLPLSFFGRNLTSSLLQGNFYKCGDKTHAPHWLSAFPIRTPKPDFHRPEYFQNLP